MNSPELFINIEDNRWADSVKDIDPLSKQAAAVAFDYLQEQIPAYLSQTNKPIIINLTLSNDETVHQLNKDYRGMDKPTNVLSFANLDDPDFEQDSTLFDEIELGDIIVAYETMKREAEEKNISLNAHYLHLLVHGLLHLLGYDHQTDEEADIMEGHEIKILEKLNISNPYTE